MTKVAWEEGWFPRATGMRIHYRLFAAADGEGRTPLVCLPGYWRNSRDYEELALHLTGRCVVTPDMRGRGLSDRSQDVADYHFDLLVEDVRALLDHLGIASAVFAGLTLGSFIAIELANREPQRVKGIILNDGGPQGAPGAAKRMSAFAGDEAVTREEALSRMRAANGPYCPGLTEEDYSRLVRRAYRETADGEYLRDFDQLTNEEMARFKAERPDFWTEYGRLSGLPMLVLKGANSDYLSDAVIERMLRENPAASVAIVRDRGHAPMLDEPDALSAVDAFLAAIDAKGPRAPATGAMAGRAL